jgi:hypothetical protein
MPQRLLNGLLNLFKRFIYLLIFLCSLNTTHSQEKPNELVQYSHSQFIEALTLSKDAVFSLKNAFIYFDREKDSSFCFQADDNYYKFSNQDTLTINKEIELENVHFEHRNSDSGLALHHIKFLKPVTVINTASLVFSNCVFKEGLFIDVNIPMNTYVDYFELVYEDYGNDISINESIIENEFSIDIGTIEVFSALFVNISNSVLKLETAIESSFAVNNIRAFDFFNNTCKGEGILSINLDKSGRTDISFNDFGEAFILFYNRGISSSDMNFVTDNIFKKPILFEVENFNKTDIYQWSNWEDNIISAQGYSEYIKQLYINRALNSASQEELFYNDSILKTYLGGYKYQIENSFKSEKRLIGSFYDFYKSQYDTDYANKVYVTLKDLETLRYQYLNEQNPSFKNYFTWKINQFLKVFSSYGTEPSKSIVMSIYVIFIFAFIYLFFPNSWDTMNRNRLIKRIRFYTRYFRNKESMKEIYQEDRKQDLMTFEEFKNYMLESQKETPSYFLWLAKPIYYFSSTNYKFISNLFDKTDILKGKWVDLPRNKKIVASIFMGLWIFILLFF